MPGRHLNDAERSLSAFWDSPPPNIKRPYLESVAVSGGLRGIEGLLVPFRYPISAICGKNGVGKSTVLALAALAFHSPPDWNIPIWLYQPRFKAGGSSYYRFGDFFLRAGNDRTFDGVSVRWTYRGSVSVDPVTFTKSPSRWGRYKSRPEREVAFSPLGRLLSAHETAGLRTAFANQLPGVGASQLSLSAMQDLSYIMAKQYTMAEIQEVGRHTLQRARSGAEFTGFNMGSGESSAITLLQTLQGLPRGGLLVVEEIEAGLHPEAQKRLARILVRTCLERQAQIICSTHSEPFLDSLPRQARILLSKRGDEHEVFESPSTRSAMYEMLGEIQPELTIYCEDFTAKVLIEEALAYNLKVRSAVREIGSNVAVIRQGVSHMRSGYEMKALCVLDGDCSDSNVRRLVAAEGGNSDELQLVWTILPGGLSPEKWVTAQLDLPDYRARFAEQFNCSAAQAVTLIEKIAAEHDHHNLGYLLHQQTGFDQQDCVRRTMRAVAPVHPELDQLRDKIEKEIY